MSGESSLASKEEKIQLKRQLRDLLSDKRLEGQGTRFYFDFCKGLLEKMKHVCPGWEHLSVHTQTLPNLPHLEACPRDQSLQSREITLRSLVEKPNMVLK